MTKKLIVSDIDGTLLNHRHKLTKLTIDVVRQLVAKGFDFVIATGRNHHDADAIRQRLGIECYLISSNGAMITNPNGEVMNTSVIAPEVVKDILAIELPLGVYRNIYQGTDWYIEEPEQIFGEYYQEGDIRPQVVALSSRMAEDTNKIFFTSNDYVALDSLRNIVMKRYAGKVEATFSLPICLEIMDANINKGMALQQVVEDLKGSLEDVVAFGDGLNDYEMLQIAGEAYITKNGSEELKRLLPHRMVIGPNSEDSVARKIQELFDV